MPACRRPQVGYILHNIVIDWTCGLITAWRPRLAFDTRTRSWNNYFPPSLPSARGSRGGFSNANICPSVVSQMRAMHLARWIRWRILVILAVPVVVIIIIVVFM